MGDVLRTGPCRRFAGKLGPEPGLGLGLGLGSGFEPGLGAGQGSGLSQQGLGGSAMPYLVALRLVDREGVLHPPGYANADEEWPSDDVEGD